VSAGRTAILLVLLALVLPGIASAQGLGDVAARERAKRAKQEAAKKTPVITNEDLDKGRPAGAASTSGEGASSTVPEGGGDAPASPPLEDRFAAERAYLDAVQAARGRVAALESRIQELQAKLNPMNGSFIYGPTGSNSANEEAEVRSQLQQAEGELDGARQALVDANQALEDVQRGRSPRPSVAR
jgi:hypothetical protein